MSFNKFLFGLGNPGPQYSYSPHNLGFLFIDRILANFPHLAYQKTKLQESWACRIKDSMVFISKPRTFMNLSGQAVREAFQKFYAGKVADFIEKLLVVHDEVELKNGEIKLKDGKVNGGHRGHNGLRNIGEQFGYLGLKQADANGFLRIRIGCGRPASGPLDSYVLRNLEAEKWKELEAKIDEYINSVQFYGLFEI